MNMKRIFALCLSICMLLTMVPATVYAGTSRFVDFPTGWSQEAMTAAVNNGLLVGVSDNEIKPADNLTRAEFATIVARAFGASTVADISAYTDVPQDAWYYTYIAKAVKMEAMQGKSATEMDPEANITREEAFTALARVLVLESSDYSSLSKFPDASEISDWAKPYLSALSAKGYVNGDHNGYVTPKANITREEFAQVMHNMIKRYIVNPGTYSEVLPGITVVRCGDVTINGTVQGDLVIGDGAMKNPVMLSNVSINGRLLTRGGTMTLKNTTTDEGVVVKNVNGVTQFMNYRTEKVFEGIREITEAEFLKIGGNFGNASSGSAASKETLTFYVDDEVFGTITVKYGSVIGDKLPEAPEKEGYTFLGWYKNASGEGEPIGKDTVVKNSFDVYGVWEAKTYDVTFNPDNDEAPVVVTGTYDVAIGSGMPLAPSKDGFVFAGWFDANGVEITENTIVKGAIHATAKWDPEPVESFKVTFKSGGMIYATVYVEEGQAIGAQMPADPTRTGYVFAGWEDANGNPVTDATVVNGVMDVNAIWTAETYNLVFDADNGEAPVTIVGTYNEEIGSDMPSDPSKTGHTFVGWEDQNGNPVTENTVVRGPMNITAIWDVDEYTLTFDPDNGDAVITENVEYNTAIGTKLPANPSKAGHIFLRWEDENSNAVTSATVVTGPMNITAIYELIPIGNFKVTFKVDGAAVSEIYVADGSAIGGQMPADPTKTGHTFLRWEDENGNEVTSATTVTAELIVNAVFDANDYTLTFDPDNGGAVTTITVTYGDAIGLQMPSDPSKTGHTFVGWKDQNGNPVTDATIVEEDMQITAEYTVNDYTLTFDPDNGGAVTTITVTYGDAIGLQMPSDPSKTGHTFVGWKDQNGNPVTDATIVEEDMQITAEYTVNDYTLTFDPDNGGAVTTITVTYGDAIGLQMPSDPAKAGHTFVGWKDGNGNPVTDATIVEDDMQITAEYTVNDYTLTFNPDNGEAVTTITVTYGDAIGLQMPSDPTKSGWTFMGWEDQNGNPVTDTTIVEGDMQITAVWQQVVVGSFTVTFVVDGATYETITVADGAPIGGQMPDDPVVTGKNFLGWKDQNGNAVSSGTTVTEDLTVTAELETIQVTVNFKVDAAAATPVHATLTRDYGWTLAEDDVTEPTLQGYVFKGWIFYNGTPVEYGVTQFTEDVTVYAKWEPGNVSYTVNHYVQKLDDTYELITETKTGTTGADTEAEAKTEYNESHDTQSFSQKTIQADGTTVVDIYYNLKQFTVVFEANGGLFSDSSIKKEIEYKYGEALNVRCPLDASRTDYLFKGWYSNAEGTGDEVVTTTVVKNGFTLYAKWELIPADSFVVTFKLEATDTDDYASIYVEDGQTIGDKMPADPTKTGYTFLRWEDENGNVVDENYVVSAATTAVAVWEVQTYTVRFFNGAEAVAGKQLGDNLSVEYNDNVENAEYPTEAIKAAENVKAIGYIKKADWAAFYNNDKHEVFAQWMYVNPETGAWELFDENVAITGDTDVHLLLKRIFFMIENDRLPQAFQVQAHYIDSADNYNPTKGEPTRLRDTGKDLLASFNKQMDWALDMDIFTEKEAKLFNKLADLDLITENREIKISKLPVKITTVIKVEDIEKEVKQYIENALEDPDQLDSVLAMVDIQSLIATIGIDKIITGLPDDVLLTLLTDTNNRELVVNAIYDNLSNPILQKPITDYLKDEIIGNEEFREQLAATVAGSLMNSLDDEKLLSLMKGPLKETVIDYVVDNATGTLKPTIISFLEKEAKDPDSAFFADLLAIIRQHLEDDALLRKEILSNRVLLETMLDFFEDDVIDLISTTDALIENALKQDNVKADFLDELVESEHFIEEVLHVHPEYLTNMVKDGGDLHATAESALQSDAFKADIFEALKADSSFAAFFTAGSALETVVSDLLEGERDAILAYITEGTGDYSDYDSQIEAAVQAKGFADLADFRNAYALLDSTQQADACSEIWAELKPEIVTLAMDSFTQTGVDNDLANDALAKVMADYLDKTLPTGIDEALIDTIFVAYVNDTLHETGLHADIAALIESVKTEVKDVSNGPLAGMSTDELINFVKTYRDDHPDEVKDVLHTSYDVVEDYVLDGITDSTAATYDPTLYAEIDELVADHASEVQDNVIISLINELLNHNIDLLDAYIELLMGDETELRKCVTLFIESDSFDKQFVTTYRAGITSTMTVDDYADILLKLAQEAVNEEAADGALGTASTDLISDMVSEFIQDTSDDTVITVKSYIGRFVENDLDVDFIKTNRAIIDQVLIDADVADLIDTDMIKKYVAEVNKRGETDELADMIYGYLKDLQYYKDFIAAFKNGDDSFEVTKDSAVFASAIANAVSRFTYEEIIVMVDNPVVDKVLEVMGDQFLKEMFDTATADYAKGLQDTVDEVQADGQTREYTTSIIFKANVVQLLNDIYEKAQLKAEEKLLEYPALRYDENEYLQFIVQHNPIDELLIHVGPATDELTGYKLKDTADTMDYLDYAEKMVMIADDAILWYGDTANLSEAEIEALFDAIYGKADKAQAKINELLIEFEATGDLPDKVEKLINKVSKVNELLDRFEPKIDKVINIYLDSAYSDIGEEKPKKAYDILLGIEEPVITVDFLYDIFYSKEPKLQAKLKEKIDDGTLQKAIDKFESTSIKEIVDRLGNEKASTYAEKLDEIKNSGRVESAFDSLYDVLVMVADQGVDVLKAPANTNTKLIVVDAYQINIRGVKFTIQRDMR